MRYRKLDAVGDMTFGNQQADFYRDVPEAPAQAIYTRLGLMLGEFFVDVTEGTDYVGGVLGKYTQDSADLIIRERILGAKGVSAILSYESSYDADTRTWTARGTADTIYGEISFVGVV